jgi:hypothetical protein
MIHIHDLFIYLLLKTMLKKYVYIYFLFLKNI